MYLVGLHTYIYIYITRWYTVPTMSKISITFTSGETWYDIGVHVWIFAIYASVIYINISFFLTWISYWNITVCNQYEIVRILCRNHGFGQLLLRAGLLKYISVTLVIITLNKEYTTGVHKSRALGRHGDPISSGGAWYLWGLCIELASCHRSVT